MEMSYHNQKFIKRIQQPFEKQCFKYGLSAVKEQHGFSHSQGSGYISDEKLSTADIYDLMDDLTQRFTWIGVCVNKIDVTNIGRQHDLTELLKPAEELHLESSILLEAEGEK